MCLQTVSADYLQGPYSHSLVSSLCLISFHPSCILSFMYISTHGQSCELSSLDHIRPPPVFLDQSEGLLGLVKRPSPAASQSDLFIHGFLSLKLEWSVRLHQAVHPGPLAIYYLIYSNVQLSVVRVSP